MNSDWGLRRVMFGLAVVGGLGLGAAAAAAQPADIGRCDNQQTQIAMNACARAAYVGADVAMGQVYDRLLARLSDEARPALRAGQGAWTVYRAKHCAFVSGGTTGGSIAPMIYSQCAQSLTAARTAALVALADCEEGDLSCPR